MLPSCPLVLQMHSQGMLSTKPVATGSCIVGSLVAVDFCIVGSLFAVASLTAMLSYGCAVCIAGSLKADLPLVVVVPIG